MPKGRHEISQFVYYKRFATVKESQDAAKRHNGNGTSSSEDFGYRSGWITFTKKKVRGWKSGWFDIYI